MKTAIYSGSFDPLTNGHMWVIKQAAQIFDVVHVVLGMVPGKPGTFSQDARLSMMQESIRLPNTVVELRRGKNIVEHIHDMPTDPSEVCLIRGMRDAEDFSYESQVSRSTTKLDGSIKQIFLIPPDHLRDVSSTEVRNWWFDHGSDTVKDMVPEPVFKKIKSFEAMIKSFVKDLSPEEKCLLDGKSSEPSVQRKTYTFFGKMKDHYQRMIDSGLIRYRPVIDFHQVKAMLDPCPINLVVSTNFHLAELAIDLVRPTGQRHLPCSQSLGPIIVDANTVLSDTSEYGELGPVIVIEGKHRWLDARERGESTILAWVGEQAIFRMGWNNLIHGEPI